MHKNIKTVKNYIGPMRTGPIVRGAGYTIRTGWTNPNNAKNLHAAGFRTEREIINEASRKN